jgi:hypothetical protein
MWAVACEPVSPVAIPAKDSVSGWESLAPKLVVDLAVDALSVGRPSAVDVVDCEELVLLLAATGALSAVGVEHGISEFAALLAVVGADVFAVGLPPSGVVVAELLSVGLAAFSVSRSTAVTADVPAACRASVNDELVGWSSLAAPLTCPFVH